MGHSNNQNDLSKSPNDIKWNIQIIQMTFSKSPNVNSKCPNELKGKQEHQKQTYIIYEYIHTTKI
jgi:hypothetical protein